MRAEQRAAELRQFFQIKKDLVSATRENRLDDVDFHIGELAAIRLHTTNERLRDACSAAIAERNAEVDAA